MLLRRYVPYEVRLRIRLARRAAADRRAGTRFAATRAESCAFPCVVGCYGLPFIDYPGQEQLAAAKRGNQALLAAAIDGVIVAPGEAFSLWGLAGRPTAANGYREAAAIKAGVLTTDIGGSTCLLSTVLFNAGLLSGLEVVERHCHSVDSYGSRRYFELGRDASVEYGYRDLRLRNRFDVPLRLAIHVDDRAVVAGFASERPLDLDVRIVVSVPELRFTPGGPPLLRARASRTTVAPGGSWVDAFESEHVIPAGSDVLESSAAGAAGPMP